jgi:Raf kinase inhibitor-like YbhB/YbcL family protein
VIGRIAAVFAAVGALAACGSHDSAGSAGNSANADVPPPAAPMPPPPGYVPDLTSDFAHNATIPIVHTCDGAGTAPPLRWGEAREGTRSFALVVDDPDAPHGTFYHWGVYDIPVTARAIIGWRAPGITLLNDFGKPGYGAPCPPKGSGLHHYRFKLYALKVHHLELKRGASIADLEAAVLHAAAAGHALTESTLFGYYERR